MHTMYRESMLRRRPWLLLCLILLLPAVPTTVSASSYLIYVTNEASGDVSVVDPSRAAEINRIRLGKRPRGIAVSPDKRFIYVALSGSPASGPGVDESALPPADKGADGIAVIDPRSQKVLRVLRGISDPEQLAVSPDGHRLYVASEDSGKLIVMNASSGQRRAELDVGGEPEGIAVSADGNTILVTSEEDGIVNVIKGAPPKVLARIGVGERPRGVAFLPSGTRAAVTGENDASLTMIDLEKQSAERKVHIDGKNARPMGVAAAGDRLFITTGRGGEILAARADNLEIVGRSTVGPRPWGLAMSPDGTVAITANGPSNDITFVDTATLRIKARVKVGQHPWGVVVLASP